MRVSDAQGNALGPNTGVRGVATARGHDRRRPTGFNDRGWHTRFLRRGPCAFERGGVRHGDGDHEVSRIGTSLRPGKSRSIHIRDSRHVMTITRTEHGRTHPALDWTESRPACAYRLIPSPVNSPTLAITAPVRASHTRRLPSRARVRGGSARLTTRSSRAHGIQSP